MSDRGCRGDRRAAHRRPYLGAGAVRLMLTASAFACVAFAPIGAHAQSERWQCQTINELEAFAVTEDDFILNNFRLREDTGFLSNRPYIEISFSAVNRKADPLFVSVQFLGLGEQGIEPIIALSAEPSFSMVGERATEQISASVNTTPGELGDIKHFCLRVDG